MGNELELCCKCVEPTGRSGRSEDSLYADDLGPYCEICWGDLPDELAADNARLRAELEEANKKLAHWCADEHDGVYHAAREDDERCPVCRVRDALQQHLAAAEAARDEAVERFDAERVVHRQTLEAWKMLTEERDEARRERDEANEVHAKRNSDVLSALGYKGDGITPLHAAHLRFTQLIAAQRDRDTHKARADAAEALLRGMGVERPAHPPSDEYYMDWRGRVFAHFRSFASPGATTEAEQARGGESSPSEGGAQKAREAGDA